MIRLPLLITAVVFLAACASGTPQPVLYPNAYLKQVGAAQAQRDIDECSRMADAYVRQNPGAKVVGDTIVGGAGGAAIGGAAGAVTGNLGRGAGIGAAAGATAGLIRGAAKASQPSPVYKAFVNRCLREKGYEPIGWE